MRPHLRKALAVLQLNGAADIVLEPGGKHFKLKWRKGDEKRLYILAATPSDHRAERNMLADLRRMTR